MHLWFFSAMVQTNLTMSGTMLYQMCTGMGLVPEAWICPQYLLAPPSDDGTGNNDGETGWSHSWLASTWVTFSARIDSYLWAAFIKAPFRWLGRLITWIIDSLGDELVGQETWSWTKQKVWVVILLTSLTLCFLGIDWTLRPFVRCGRTLTRLTNRFCGDWAVK